MRVLAVERHEGEAAVLLGGLRRLGYQAEVAGTGAQTLRIFRCQDLVLLDLDLPDIDGLSVCREIRAAGDVPLIAFARGSGEMERVLSLEAGADDCLAKPYGMRELAARIRAVMRRVRPGAAPARVIQYDGMLIDAVAREVTVDGRRITVTRKEFDLLNLLAAHPGRVFPREELMARVWQESEDSANHSARSSRTLDTHIGTLRNKIGGDCIVTVRGVGYRFDAGRTPSAACAGLAA